MLALPGEIDSVSPGFPKRARERWEDTKKIKGGRDFWSEVVQGDIVLDKYSK